MMCVLVAQSCLDRLSPVKNSCLPCPQGNWFSFFQSPCQGDDKTRMKGPVSDLPGFIYWSLLRPDVSNHSNQNGPKTCNDGGIGSRK